MKRLLALALLGCSAETGLLPLEPIDPMDPIDPIDRPDAPRPLEPLSGSLTGALPLARWYTEGHTTIQVCRDRACTDVVGEERLIGQERLLDLGLDDRVFYWRVRDGEAVSATWTLRRTANAFFDSPFGSTWDLDGDGRSELVVAAPRSSRIEVHDYERGFVRAIEGAGFFGHSMDAGDFDGDGLIDLALGDPTEIGLSTSVDPSAAAGRIVIEYGNGRGELLDGGQPSTMFGYALSYAGDVDLDGYGDLVAGIPRSGIGAASQRSDVGRVRIYFGGKNGLDPARTVEQESPIAGVRFFGSAVGGGSDVDGDKLADVTASHPGDPLHLFLLRGGRLLGSFETLRTDLGQEVISGDRAAFVLAGSLWIGVPSRLSGRLFVFHQDRAFPPLPMDVPGFGSSVAIGDWNGDRELDVSVGSIGEVQTFYAAGAGTEPIVAPDEAAALGQFGRAMRSLDADGDGRSDLLVSAPGTPSSPNARNYLYLGSEVGLGPAPVLLIEPE